MINVRDATALRGDRRLLDGVSFNVAPGTFCVVVGPNGAGKSTLLKALVAFEALSEGTVLIGDDSIQAMSHAIRARHMSYLPQERTIEWPLTVEATVALGRFAHGTRQDHRNDRAVEQAIQTCRLTELRHRRVDTLSGGERTRVHLARLFASEAEIIVADEPTAALDANLQHQTLATLKMHVANGHTVIAALHELPLAWQFADQILVLNKGELIADGPPQAVLTPDLIASVFNVCATRITVDGADQLFVTALP